MNLSKELLTLRKFMKHFDDPYKYLLLQSILIVTLIFTSYLGAKLDFLILPYIFLGVCIYILIMSYVIIPPLKRRNMRNEK